MKVLSAVYPHGTWDGEILWDGQPLKAQSISETEAAGIVIIHQELTLVPDLSVAENIFMGHEFDPARRAHELPGDAAPRRSVDARA